MKKLLKLLAATMVAASALAQSTTSTSAVGDKPPFWMLQSQGALRAYAFSQVTRGDANVWGETIVYKENSRTYIEADNDSPNGILHLLSGENGEFSFDIIDPIHDNVGIGANLTDANYNGLFYGYAFGLCAQRVGDSWRLPVADITLRMSDWIPIPVPIEASDARFYYRDDEGNLRWTDWNLNAYRGTVYFPSKYAGHNGQIVLSGKDGTLLIIDIGTGRSIDPVHVGGAAEFGIANYTELSDKGVTGTVWDFQVEADYSDDPTQAPVLWVSLEQGRSLRFTAKVVRGSVIIEIISRGHALNKRTGEIRDFSIPSGSTQLGVDLPGPDVWVIWFDTDQSFNHPPEYPYYGGGKG